MSEDHQLQEQTAAGSETFLARIETLEAQLAAALQEAAERDAELGLLSTVEQALNQQTDIQGIYELVGDWARDIFQADATLIVIYDRRKGVSRTPYLYEKGVRYHLPERPIGGHGAAQVKNAKPVVYNTVEEWQAGGLHQIEGTEVMQSFLGVPLVVGNTVIGGINLQDERPYAFDEADVRLLSTLASSMSIALENARLFDETQRLLRESEQRNAELAVINSVQQGLASKLSLDEIYELVGERIRDIFNAQAVMIATYNIERGLAYLKYLYEKGERYAFAEGQPFNKLTHHLISTRETMLINSDSKRVAEEFEMGTPAGEHPLSMVFVPLITRDEVSGFISLQDIDSENAFSPSDVRLLETLAASMSVALENAHLFGETERWAKENSALAAVGRDISATLDLPTVLERIARHARELLQASDCAVFLPDEKGGRMKAFIALGSVASLMKKTDVLFGRGILGDVWRKGEAELINNASADPRGIKIEGTEDQPDEKLMVTPLLSGEEVTGIMAVWRLGGSSFVKANLDFLTGLARQASIAIENARLFAEAEKARAAAEEANRSKSAFLANVSHELRTPLTSILGFAHVVQNRLDGRVYPEVNPQNERAQRAMVQIDESLAIILSEGERLTALINNVLDLEKIEAGKMEWRMEPLQLDAVLKQAIDASISLVEQKGLRMVQAFPDTLPTVIGDRDKLVQVMINLISNAIKFTEAGEITCSISRQGNDLQVSVADSGIGISEDDRLDVFAKFNQVGDTLTDKPRGTGLGLSIAKEIVEHHGGRIWVDSIPGHGSIFSFTLPISNYGESGKLRKLSVDELLVKLKDRAARVRARQSGEMKRILVADDDASIRKLLVQELGNEGYSVDEAADGRSALQLVKEQPFDLVILDVLMPELSGFDVAAVIRHDPRTTHLPIMIVSVLEDQDRGYQIGVDRYLTKPLILPALMEEVDVLLDRGTSQRKVLVIDENAETVETLSAALRAQGFAVTSVNSGPDALQAAAASKPDMIIANAVLSEQYNLVQTVRFSRGLESVSFLLFE